MDASRSFCHVGSKGQSCGGQMEMEDRSIERECEESIASSGWQARGDHHGEHICTCRSFKITQPTHPLLISSLCTHSGLRSLAFCSVSI
jgi:hypothetical protein